MKNLLIAGLAIFAGVLLYLFLNLSSENKELTKEYKDLKEYHKLTEDILESKKVQIAELRSQIDSQNNNIVVLKTKKDLLQTTLNKSKNDVVRLSNQIKSNMSDTAKKLEDCDSLALEIQPLIDKIDSTRKLNDSLTVVYEIKDNLKDGIINLKDSIILTQEEYIEKANLVLDKSITELGKKNKQIKKEKLLRKFLTLTTATLTTILILKN